MRHVEQLKRREKKAPTLILRFDSGVHPLHERGESREFCIREAAVAESVDGPPQEILRRTGPLHGFCVQTFVEDWNERIACPVKRDDGDAKIAARRVVVRQVIDRGGIGSESRDSVVQCGVILGPHVCRSRLTVIVRDVAMGDIEKVVSLSHPEPDHTHSRRDDFRRSCRLQVRRMPELQGRLMRRNKTLQECVQISNPT